MENPSFQDKLLEFLRQNLLISCLFVGGLILLGIGLIQYFSQAKSDVEFQKGEQVEAASPSASLLYVDVSGEVVNPGVYKLSSQARIQDALVAAGGLGPDADRKYVARSINLASALRDGMKIYIPKQGESMPVGNASNSDLSVGSQGPASINSASESELEALPGIGPVTAGKIINGRPYTSIDELLSKKVVGKSVFEKIKDLVSL